VADRIYRWAKYQAKAREGLLRDVPPFLPNAFKLWRVCILCTQLLAGFIVSIWFALAPIRLLPDSKVSYCPNETSEMGNY